MFSKNNSPNSGFISLKRENRALRQYVTDLGRLVRKVYNASEHCYLSQSQIEEIQFKIKQKYDEKTL